MAKKAIISTLFLVILTSFAPAATLNVYPDGSGPYPTIQAAINAASPGDHVVLATGTYIGPENRDIDFLGKPITVKSENGPQNCIIDCNGTETDRHRGFYFHSGEDANSVINGFTIINGFASFGGAIRCESSDPTINNCTIKNSKSGVGGAICCYRSSPIVTNCTITDNDTLMFGGEGGAIYCGESQPTIADCNISGNSAWCGGAIYCDNASPTITNCTLSSNLSEIGGGSISCFRYSNPTIEDCNITDNLARDTSGTGGGIEWHTGSSPTISGCRIINNEAPYGGAIFCSEASPTIKNCIITHNFAERGGTILCWYNSSLNITNCTISNNSAPNGNALAFHSLQQPSNLRMTNCILRNGGDEIWNNDDSTIDITYSDITGGFPGHGNIDADPLFIDPGFWDPNSTPDDSNDDFWVDGDYHLQPNSPCINKGDPNYVPEPDETDLDGNPRIIDGIVDMGAYEFYPYIEAQMNLTPQSLNCKSKGNWLKAHITLPEDFYPEDVDTDTPATAQPLGIESEYIEVFGSDNSAHVEIGFDRQDFCAALSDDSMAELIDGGTLELTVIGHLTTGRLFTASDSIKIKH